MKIKLKKCLLSSKKKNLPVVLLLFPQSVCNAEEGAAEDDSFRETVELAVQRLYDALNPVM